MRGPYRPYARSSKVLVETRKMAERTADKYTLECSCRTMYLDPPPSSLDLRIAKEELLALVDRFTFRQNPLHRTIMYLDPPPSGLNVFFSFVKLRLFGCDHHFYPPRSQMNRSTLFASLFVLELDDVTKYKQRTHRTQR